MTRNKHHPPGWANTSGGFGNPVAHYFRADEAYPLCSPHYEGMPLLVGARITTAPPNNSVCLSCYQQHQKPQ